MTTPSHQSTAGNDRHGASATETRTARDDQTTKEALLGTDRPHRSANVSWGAIFAGILTFLALTVLLAMVGAAMGLDGFSPTAAGVWTIIILALALAAAGYVAGALAIRSGLLHGFLTWAGSVVVVTLLAGWLTTNVLGAVGNIAGSIAQQTNISSEQAQDAAQRVQGQVDQQDVNRAQQQLGQTANDAATGMWWAVAGTIIGAGIAAATGFAGSRSVQRKETEVTSARR